MKKFHIGMVGCGFAAQLHMEAWRLVHGYEAVVAALATKSLRREQFAARHGIEKIYDTLEELLRDPTIDIVDICTPPDVHGDMIVKSLAAGKHTICEKPLCGYFAPGDTPKDIMYDAVMAELERLKLTVSQAGAKFFYAENFVYAPAVVKSREILEKTKQKILLMKGEESHSGSHAPHAARWSHTGGGSLIRQGCHPLSALLYLKQIEAKVRGENIALAAVTADVGNAVSALAENERAFIQARPVDVEDIAVAVYTFSDGTKAAVLAGDMVTGGVRNLIELYTNEGVQLCNIAPNDSMRVYQVRAEALSDVYVTEKVETKAGWQDVCVEESFARGYVGEMQDFLKCVDQGKEPQSGITLACETMKAIYGAYRAAESGVKFHF
ncbi:MAG: Gfo/Idh/MocA family oxidoreductase [Fusobacteriaceae bacterium]|nr:Gfo/Idh/MocA family oxidoreductase [Fusobacteriaceae bacterium]